VCCAGQVRGQQSLAVHADLEPLPLDREGYYRTEHASRGWRSAAAAGARRPSLGPDPTARGGINGERTNELVRDLDRLLLSVMSPLPLASAPTANMVSLTSDPLPPRILFYGELPVLLTVFAPPPLPIHPHPFPSHGSLALLTGLSAGQGSGPARGERGLPSTATLFSLPALPTRSHSLTLSLSLSVLSFTRTRARSFLLSLSFSLSLSLALANYVSCSLSPSPSSYLPPLAHQPTGLPASQSPAPPASCFPAHALSLYLSVSLSLCLSISHILVGILGRGQGRSVGGSSRPSPRVQYNGLRMASRGLDNEVEDQKTNSWLRARPLNRSPRSRLRGTMAIPGARTHRLRVAPPFLFS
jgi:hypothetical protein